jgi:hypothetical protein
MEQCGPVADTLGEMSVKRLTLKRDRLSALTETELRIVVGADAFDETYTGQVDCVLSIGPRPCVTNQFCTLFCAVGG